MKRAEVNKTLKTIGSYEEIINTVSGEHNKIKTVCKIAQNNLDAWGLVMLEMNDVITTLQDSYDERDRIYCSAFRKALQIVTLANCYKPYSG